MALCACELRIERMREENGIVTFESDRKIASCKTRLFICTKDSICYTRDHGFGTPYIM